MSSITAGIGGFAITGQVSDRAGRSVSSAGDVNGDGLADLIVGAPAAVNVDNNGSMFTNSGRSYVVFGQTNTTAIELSAIAVGSGGFVINGQFDENNRSGSSVASAGDVNGYGFADLIVGSPASGYGGGGGGYVVFGKTGTNGINLAGIAAGAGGGFAISTEEASNFTG